MNNRVIILLLLAVFLIALFAALFGNLLGVTVPPELATLLRIIGGLAGLILIVMAAFRTYKRR